MNASHPNDDERTPSNQFRRCEYMLSITFPGKSRSWVKRDVFDISFNLISNPLHPILQARFMPVGEEGNKSRIAKSQIKNSQVTFF
jgi:hypothetical protein